MMATTISVSGTLPPERPAMAASKISINTTPLAPRAAVPGESTMCASPVTSAVTTIMMR